MPYIGKYCYKFNVVFNLKCFKVFNVIDCLYGEISDIKYQKKSTEIEIVAFT